jgi:hypothetical protein
MYKLYKINIDNDTTDNYYKFIPDSDSKNFGANEYSIRANSDMLKKFLRRCRVSDATTNPRSIRSITYKEIIDLIHSQKGEVYIFSHMYPKTIDDLESIMRK